MYRWPRLLIICLIVSVSLNIFLLTQYEGLGLLTGSKVESLAQESKMSDSPIETKAQIASKGKQDDKENIRLWINAAREAFKYKAYAEALESYFQLGKISPARQKHLKAEWIDKLKVMIKAEGLKAEKSQHDAGKFIELFLGQVSYDVDLLLLQADYLVVTNQHEEAILQTYELLKTVVDIDLQQAIKIRIHRWAELKINQFSEALAWEPLIQFVEKLSWHEPRAVDYQLALAYAKYQLKLYSEAKRILVSLPDDPYYNQQIEILLEEVNRAAKAVQAVAMQKIGEHYLVRGEINEGHAISLLLDTGASLSVISENKFRQLKSRIDAVFVDEIQLNTAGGLISAPIYQVDSFQIENYKVDNIQFAVIDMDSSQQGDGLLGMNFLNRFSFQIDQEESLLYLSPR